MIRVLIADDTATTRQLVFRLLTEGGLIEVVGQAKNGQEAVEMTRQLKPDVVTMDIIMPLLDGVAATAQIMRNSPTPIIILSALEDVRRSPISMNALNNGALAILALPSLSSPDLSALASHLRETVIAVARVKSVRLEPGLKQPEQLGKSTDAPYKSSKTLMLDRAPVEIISIACSIGGPAALATILADLPKDLPVPILITQHISKGFTENLAIWLSQSTALPVLVARDRDLLSRGTVFIAPDDCHLGVKNKSQIEVSSSAAIKGFRPAANYMFESIAKVFKGASMAVILTGMGDDGLAGLKIQREQGAIIIAQDEATSVVYGMPRAAVKSGVVDLILPLDKIAATLKELVLKNPPQLENGRKR